MAAMTDIPKFLPRTRRGQTSSRTVLFVAFEGMGLLDLSGSTSVFWSASLFMKQQGKLGYSPYAVSIDGGLIITGEGISIATAPVSDFADVAIDTIVVPGAFNMEPALRDRRLVDWLRVTAPKARRMASVCAGAFLLADAGLLHQRRATTHWSSCALLGERYPTLKVEPDAIFVRDDPIWTSAGVSAGIDLSLAMVQDDCGHYVAMQVARQLVVYMKRPGGQSQFSELLQSQTTDSPVFDELHLWIAKNLQDQKLTVDMLAMRVNMSPRNFARSYKTKTGRTPAKALELFRVEAARRLLEEAKLDVDQIARSCGFGDEERMRATFKRHLAISPRDYRRRFSILSSTSAKRQK